MRRLADLTHSIRFRLTAWYGSLMIVVLLAAGLGAWTLMSSWLHADLDDQLRAGAQTYGNPEALERESRDTARLFERGEINAPGTGAQSGDEYRSLVVQLSGDVDVQAVTPFTCVVPYAAPEASNIGRLSTQDACGDTFRVLAIPLNPLKNVSTGVTYDTLVVAQSLQPVKEALKTLRNLLLALGALGVLLALQVGWVIAGRSLRPIDSVTATASTIAESPRTAESLAARLSQPDGNDEVARLTRTFNRMLDRVQSEFERRQRFVADASHELRTPLAAIRGNLDVLRLQLQRVLAALPEGAAGGAAGREAMGEGFEDLDREAARMSRLLDDLLFLARSDADTDSGTATGQATTHTAIRLDEIAAETVRSAQGTATGQRLTLEVAAPVTVQGNRDELAQLSWILLDNALRHTPPDAAIRATVDQADGTATLTVADTGDGISAADLPHVFDRFYRADTSRGRHSGGSGLGLAIASTIVAAHGGTIHLESVEGQGATFTVRLPAAASQQETDSPTHIRSA
ncbi:MAG TPA: HAMP domain-containing sensor histidine kinase [Thermomicrobiales bacterium]|jgi:signal transduction histidine kinase|nr:HAMP domain-containing sensor histidine kinase [Thermomicrobiales bacterium]